MKNWEKGYGNLKRKEAWGKMTKTQRWEGHVLMPKGLNASQMDESIGGH